MRILITILFAPVMGVLTMFYIGKIILTDLVSFAGWGLGHVLGILLFSAKWISPKFAYKFYDRLEKWSDQ